LRSASIAGVDFLLLYAVANALQEGEIELSLANFGTTKLATQWETLTSEAFVNRGKLLNL
jgi:hypothetical protein